MFLEIEVNNNTIKANKGETILSALQRNGIKIPTLCHINSLFPTGACRICMVEVEGKNNLVPACSQPVEEWMKIYTHSPKVIKARKTIVELLLSNHPDDCLYCERNGNCELQGLAEELFIRERRYSGKKNQMKTDNTSASVIRDQAKCIVCGRCVRVCEEIQGVAAIDFINKGTQTIVGPAFNKGLNYSTCIDCGQCIIACPTGALVEKSNFTGIQSALFNSEKTVVALLSPTIGISLAKEFGMKQGKDIQGLIFAALKKIGFDHVYDTSFAADVYTMETAALLADHLKKDSKEPLFSSCCPGWLKFANIFYDTLLPNIATTKSPQQIAGSLVKNYVNKKTGQNTEAVHTVAIMPCTAKKHEAQRTENKTNNIPDVDTVITTRELVRLIKLHGIDINQLSPAEPEKPFNVGSSVARMMSLSGGVTEAVIRTLHHLLTGEELSNNKITPLRNIKGSKEYEVKIGEKELSFLVTSNMIQFKQTLEANRNAINKYDFIEVMSCPNGCINGGGQPIETGENEYKAQTRTVYGYDEKSPVKQAHKNPNLIELYKSFLGEPLSEKSLELLHNKANNGEKEA